MRDPTYYIDEDSWPVREVLEGEPYRAVKKPAKADLLWMRSRRTYKQLFPTLKRFQLLNHIPNEWAMADKGLLAENLYLHDRSRAKGDFGVKDLVQETYCLYRPDECARFFDRLPQKISKDDIWILKPTDSSEGVGIHILSERAKLDELKTYCARAEKAKPGVWFTRYVVQRYIRNPLLLDGRKSEIRVYWLVASLDPLMVVMYREGTVRLNTRPFKLDDFGNTLIHVTNVARQKAHPEHDPSAILKWSFQEWERYLIEDRKLAPKNFVEKHLKPRLKQMLSFVARAAAPRMRDGLPRKGLCFGLYGADIILDETLHPWLTEVQEGPAIASDDPIKVQVIPPMLREAAAIVLEVARRKREGASLKTLDAVKRFEWVINDA